MANKKAIMLLVNALFVAQPGTMAAAEYIDPMAITGIYDESSCALAALPDNAVEEAYHIPMVLNDSVESYIEYYRTRGKIVFQSWLDNSSAYLPIMKNILRSENLPVELVYVAMIESGLDPRAVSRAKAVGPWQFMPDTAQQYGLKNDQWVDERRDYLKSTLAAARHLRELQNRLGSWPLVLAAYNAGEGKVRGAMLRTGSADFWDLKESARLGRETRNFVPMFMAVALIARDPVAYGFRIPVEKPLCFDVILVQNGSADLRTLARAAGSTYAAIKQLNPEILGRVTPPDEPNYLLKIPEMTKKSILARQEAAGGKKRVSSGEAYVYGSVLQEAGPEVDSSYRTSPYSIFVNKFTLGERSDIPVEHGTIDVSSTVILTGIEGKSDRGKSFAHSLSRTQPVDIEQGLEL